MWLESEIHCPAIQPHFKSSARSCGCGWGVERPVSEEESLLTVVPSLYLLGMLFPSHCVNSISFFVFYPRASHVSPQPGDSWIPLLISAVDHCMDRIKEVTQRAAELWASGPPLSLTLHPRSSAHFTYLFLSFFQCLLLEVELWQGVCWIERKLLFLRRECYQDSRLGEIAVIYKSYNVICFCAGTNLYKLVLWAVLWKSLRKLSCSLVYSKAYCFI